MTNFIIINFCDYLVNYPLKAEGAVAQTNKIVDGALLGKMIPGLSADLGDRDRRARGPDREIRAGKDPLRL